MARIIQSPGVQISEIDLSLRAAAAPPTTIFISGFTQRGPTSEPINISSLSEFEQIYGAPTNAAERYFYHSVKAASQSPADIMVYRLPYGSDRGLGYGNSYSALVYPCSTYSYDSVISDVATAITVDVDSAAGDPEFLAGIYSIASSSITNTNGTGTGITIQLAVGSAGEILSAGVVSGGMGYVVGDTFSVAASSITNPTTASDVNFIITDNEDLGTGTSNFEITSGAYFFGKPTHIKLNEQQYLDILRGDAFTWQASGGNTTFRNSPISELGKAGLIVLNKSQTTINSRYEGFYLNILDNSNLNPATPYDGITEVLSVNQELTSIAGADYVSLPPARLNFALSASNIGVTDSISEVMENLPRFNIDDRADDDTVAVGLFKLRQSVFSPDTIALDYVLDESFVGSFDFYRQINTETGGPAVPFFLESTDDASRNIVTLINPYISNKLKGQGWDKLNGVPKRKVRFLSAPRLGLLGDETTADYNARMGAPEKVVRGMASLLGTTNSLVAISDYVDQDLTTKIIGNVPAKVFDMLDKIENTDIYPLSITCEAGLGTIYLNSKNPATSGYFDDSVPYKSAMQGMTAQNASTVPGAAQEYLAVANEFIEFADKRRKDHIFIADPITNILIEGGNSVKTLDDPTKNFSQHIYWPLRNQFSTVNSSYVCTFANVARVADLTLNRQVWVPFSGFAAAAMGNTDATYYPWFAPAGFTRGVVTGVTDLALYPKQKQRDLLYKISNNPVAFFPNEGFVIFGQKTMLKRPSAFDRINVRRLFLYLEVQTKNTAKYFVFEPNTLFTRTNVKNILSPIFDLAKNTQGVYDYLIICDERNNTPAVIDDNSLVVDIYIKPVRAAEFILVNFYATRTGANFQEIVS